MKISAPFFSCFCIHDGGGRQFFPIVYIVVYTTKLFATIQLLTAGFRAMQYFTLVSQLAKKLFSSVEIAIDL
jgi:hypothetical protein